VSHHIVSFLCHLASMTVHYPFFFDDASPIEVYTVSLHDALPIYAATGVVGDPGDARPVRVHHVDLEVAVAGAVEGDPAIDALGRSEEHSLNSSHVEISYAVFCLKKNNKTQ